MTSERLQWFIDRIGKRVYNVATDLYSTIHSKEHAELLASMEGKKACGVKIKYYDTKPDKK